MAGIAKTVLNNGVEIPNIGFGTFPYQEVLVDRIPYSVEKENVRMVDTSDNYANEDFVGKGLSQTNNPDVIVISKFSQPFRTNEMELCFEESKKKLGKLNIYLLHWPFPFLWKEEWKRMEELYLSGKCDAIGVCNFDMGYMKELLSFCRVKPAINQFERHPLFQQQELVDFCHENGVAVMAYSPVARMDKDLLENPVLRGIADKYGKTVNQVILRWDIDTNCIPIPASSSERHIKENFDVYDFSLTNGEIDVINALEMGKRIRYNPRTRFTQVIKIKCLLYRFGILDAVRTIKHFAKKLLKCKSI